MKETLEISPPESKLQDKKNYANQGALENFISANNSEVDFITIANKKQSRITELVNFFNQLYGKIPEPHFAYLTKFKGGTKFYPFAIADETQREVMAIKAIELADSGVDIWHSVNTVSVAPYGGKRGDENVVSYQTAIVTDIDILSDAHKSTNLASNFEEAKSFLPFTPSLILNSGHGLQAYYIFEQPILITDENREELKRRNNLVLDVIRQRANGKDIDGVGDLPRILRTPSTFNCKLGMDNAPMCHVVENSRLRFSPAEIDEKLNAMIQVQKKETKSTVVIPTKSTKKNNGDFTDDRDFNIFRVRRMLDFINPSTLTYDDWLAVGMALKNIGMDCNDWENWSRSDDRFKDGECERKWQTFHENGGLTIATLHDFASKLYGYSEKAFQRDWYALHDPNPRIKHRPPDTQELAARLAELKTQPQSENRDKQIIATIRDLCTWNHDKNNNKTTIKPTMNNIELIFNNDPNLIGLFGFDQFQGANIFLKQAPWHDENKSGEKWRDSDDAELRAYLRRNYAELKEKQLIEDYVVVHARKNSFHPVKHFYETLPRWDGTPRAETLFVKFLGAEDSDYTREVTRKFLIGAIARIYHPGCDFQWAPVLQAAQRVGKSKLVKMLGGMEGVNPSGYSWHVALKDSVDDAHALDVLQIGGIVEIEEFSAARRAEINALKSFISANADSRRGAYEKHASTHKRHVVFIVTCNDQQFLRDPTGNARFWIIKCTQKKFNRVDGMTPDYIRQVWAEAYYRYMELFKDGFDESKLKPSLELEIRAEEIAESYLQDDGMTTEIKAFLEKRLPPAIIWKLMNKDDRHKFFVDGQIAFDLATLKYRRRAQGGRESDIAQDIDAIRTLLNSQRDDIRKGTTFDGQDKYIFYGSELREHICASEIYNEGFGRGDKRKLMYRFNEILDTLEGWHLGERLRNADPEYREQKKPYYRDKENRPDEPEPENQPVDNLQGTPIEPTDTPPFDPDDLPI